MPQTTSPLTAARRRRRLTQIDLADRAGVHRDTIGRLEHGDMPQLRTARSIAKALGADLDQLFPKNDTHPVGRRARVTTSASTGGRYGSSG